MISAVRGNSFSRHNGDSIKNPPENSQCDNAVIIRGVSRGALDWAPIIPRAASLSDSCTSDSGCFSNLVLFGVQLLGV